MNYAAVDIGNSRLKIMIDMDVKAFIHSDTSTDEALSYIEKQGKFPLTLCYSSVNKQKSDLFLKKIENLPKVKLYDAEILLKQQTLLKYNNIGGIGTDRLLGLYQAVKKHPVPLITVDCGTAITVNAVNEKKRCIGGSIFPGLYVAQNALKNSAEALKKFEFSIPKRAAGRTTRQAISSGLVIGTFGAIYEINNLICGEEFDGVQVPMIVTGAYGEIMIPYLAKLIKDLYYEKNLVLYGILSLLKDSLKNK